MPARSRAKSTGPCGEVTGERAFELYGAGRTDAGVHALGQVAHLDVRTSLPPDTLVGRVNDLLPADIHVLRRHQGAPSVPRATRRACRAPTSTRSPGAARPLPSRSCGGSKTICESARCGSRARAFTGRQDFRGFTDDDPDEKSTLVEVGLGRADRERRRAAAGRRRVALPVEDGAADDRRARRSRARRTRAARRDAAAGARPADCPRS